MDDVQAIVDPPDQLLPPAKFSDLVRATQFGRYEECRQYLDSQLFDVNQRDSENVSLLHWAAINNQANIVDYYIGKGAEINAIGGDLMSTPLQWAVRQGHLSMVVQLIKRGADLNIFDGEGCNALHLAAQFGHTPIVAYLVAKGLDVNLPDTNGMTALMWSAHRVPKVDPTRLLITLGSSLDMVDYKNKNTALHWAVYARNLTAITLLIDSKANVEALNANCETPIDIARKHQAPWIIQMLETQVSRTSPGDDICRRIQSNKQLCTVLRNMIPFLSYFLVGFTIDSNASALVKIICLIGISIILFLFSRALHESCTSTNFPVAVCLSLAFWLYYTLFFYLSPCKYISKLIHHLTITSPTF